MKLSVQETELDSGIGVDMVDLTTHLGRSSKSTFIPHKCVMKQCVRRHSLRFVYGHIRAFKGIYRV